VRAGGGDDPAGEDAGLLGHATVFLIRERVRAAR
jgi:hypothetical protein